MEDEEQLRQIKRSAELSMISKGMKIPSKYRRTSSILKALSIGLILGLCLGLAAPLYPKTITLIHSNDIHGIFKPYKLKLKDGERLVGGMEALSHYINELKIQEKNIFLMDLGDLMTGTLAAELDYKGAQGGAMIEFLNRLEYDVFGLGNHEFDLGQDNALKLVKLARFPSIIANIIYQKDGKNFPVDPYHIFELAGLKVGVVAVMEENFVTEVHKKHIQGLSITPIIPTLDSIIPALDEQTDLIVTIVHSTFKDGLRVAESVERLDVVLVASEDGRFEVVKGVPVKSTFGHQRTLGYLKLEVEDDKVVSYEEDLIWLWADVDLEPSSEATALVQEIELLLNDDYAQVIGQAKADLNRRNYPLETEYVENALGDWITDVMRWKTGTQIGLYNSGGIRSSIYAGPITKANIFNVCPFRNTLIVFELTGKQVKEILELDVERDRDRLQVSGLMYQYKPKDAEPFGKRVHQVEINGDLLVRDGKILSPEKIYTVVTNDYVVGQAQDKYFGFPVIESKDTGYILTKAMMEWLKKYKVLDYQGEKRIIEIKKQK